MEADETYVGGLAKNMHAKVRRQRIHGRGGVDKTAVAGLKDRATGKATAKVVAATDGPRLRGFGTEHSVHGAMVYTDDHVAYRGLPRHQAVQHSVAEYVKRTGTRQRRRVVLGVAQAGLPRGAPPHVGQAPRPLCGRVLRTTQQTAVGHRGHDGRERAGHGRQAAHLRRVDRRAS